MPPRALSRLSWRLALWPGVLALGLMSVLSAAAWTWHADQQQLQAQQFDVIVDQRVQAFDFQLSAYLQALQSVSSYVAAAGDLRADARADAFQAFARPLQQAYPELQFIAWIQTGADRDVRVHQIAPEPLQERFLGQTLQTLIPELDSRQLPDVRNRQARIFTHRPPAQSPTLDLLQPVVNTPGDGAQRFLGHIVLRVSVADYVHAVTRSSLPGGLDHFIYEGPAQTRALLAFVPSRSRRGVPTEDPAQLLASATQVERFDLLRGGLEWQIALAAVPGRFDNEPDGPITLLLAGLLLTGVACALLYRHIARAEALGNQLEEQSRTLSVLEDRQRLTLEELDSLSYAVSHDLRAPLRHIRAYAQLLLDDLPEDADATLCDRARRIADSGAKMSRLLDDLLRLSRAGRAELQRETLNLSTLASATYLERREQYPNRDIHFRCQPELFANADLELMRLALNNLFDNALKYTTERVLTELQFGAEVGAKGETVFFVRDNGSGFEQRFAERLFTPFNQLNAEDHFGGIGIGLAIVKRVVTRHGGRIWARGEVDQGATFFFTLPAPEVHDT